MTSCSPVSDDYGGTDISETFTVVKTKSSIKLLKLTKRSCPLKKIWQNEILSTLLSLWKCQYLHRERRGAVVLGVVACWNIQDSRGDEWALLGAFNQRSQSPAPPGERLMGTGYFIRPSTSLPRIWGCNCVCFYCCFVLQADKEEPAGWRSLGSGSQGAIRCGRTRSRKGKRAKRAWRFNTSMTDGTARGGLKWSLLTWCIFFNSIY